MSGTILRPDAVFDGERLHRGWAVRVEGERIAEAGPAVAAPDGATTIDLAGTTLLPGLIDLHTHLLLHPYEERPWVDQVLRDPESLRVARAVVAAKRTLEAGFTTVRDLGTEGAGEADVGLRRAIEEGVVAGPRIVCVTRAIVARGTYGPTGFHSGCCVPQGAEEVDGAETILRVTRMQIARGADWIKVYADYRFGPANDSRPTFSQDELALIVRVAHDAGVPVAAHAITAEAMRRAALAGVQTIEHGNEGTRAVFDLMAERGTVYVPTLAAYEALERIRNQPKDHPAVVAKRAAFDAARASGVTIANGSDIGVFPHGQNAREIELLVEHGLSPIEALRAATSVAARVLRYDGLGTIRSGAHADLLAVLGDPTVLVGSLRDVRLISRSGSVSVYEHFKNRPINGF
ncbi:MAG TPA: amidohydrolase family protein [Candidatus Elarobacter sp.]|nr:amidohydrolase family protein [Candidatus Elarobacter sp.]